MQKNTNSEDNRFLCEEDFHLLKVAEDVGPLMYILTPKQFQSKLQPVSLQISNLSNVPETFCFCEQKTLESLEAFCFRESGLRIRIP